MNEDDKRVRRQVRISGEAGLNDLDKWRWDNIRTAEERASRRRAADRERRQRQERNEIETLRREMWGEFCACATRSSGSVK
jgi:hypothetical protein